MKLGIIGNPQTGKTTIFNALTRQNQPTVMSGRMEIHTAVVDVPDPRINHLASIYHPKKVTFAKVTYADIAGLEGSGQGAISGPLRNELGNMDAFLQVVRCFEDDSVPHPGGPIDPARDIGSMNTELLLNDMITVESKLERLEADRGKGGRDKEAIEKEIALFARLQDHLAEGLPLREMTLSSEDIKEISGYQFLTRKPMLIVLNLGEGQSPPDVAEAAGGLPVVGLQGQLEMELAQLPEDEAAEFLSEYGISEPGLNRMIRESYDLLGLLSFFTVGEDEVRSWPLKIGDNAQQAAGVIHSDLARGFIRAEVARYDYLVESKSLSALRDQGKLQVEGKQYIVRDGDIVHVRFNV
ncbi:MAG: redox-regulated ATPase YchF [Anaerolineales bacterium]|nr:redox-regulated ATPase YchF [Anaerolineales bacterium]